MLIPNHISNSKVILLDLDVLITIITVGAWGGIVSYLLRKSRRKYTKFNTRLKYCLTQIIISCFTSFLLSIVAIEKAFSFNMVLLVAGLGGVFSGPVLRFFNDWIKKYFDNDR